MSNTIYEISDKLENILDPVFYQRLKVFYATRREGLPEPRFDSNAIHILEERYFLKDSNRNILETPDSFLCRVALAVSFRGDYDNLDPENYDYAVEYYKMMANLDFLPNSPTLMNAGTKLGQLSACFVLPVKDSITGIFDAIKWGALVHQSGGGTGYDFSNLRPEGDIVKSTTGIASGPLSFLKVFNEATQQIKQGGTRRGANMGILRVDHPDIRKFITCKDKEGDLSNFNISIAITKEFMDALNGQGLSAISDSKPTWYNIYSPKDGAIARLENAEEIWQLLIEHAWITGDPGVVFIDIINDENIFNIAQYPDHIINSTNPCGEQPLEDFEACNLGSINLLNFVSDYFDLDRLGKTVALATHFLDDVIDSSRFPIEEIQNKVLQNRKIGLGVMGWADTLIAKRIEYGSTESLDLAEHIMSFIRDTALRTSKELARERGSFPTISESLFSGQQVRNATVTTIAPTGTISMLANGVSSGIEPVFSLAFKKNVMGGIEYIHPGLFELQENNDFDSTLKFVLDNGRLPASVVAQYPYLNCTAMTISPEDHVMMQATFQNYTDNAVSKTVNLPNEATVEDIDKIYRLAYELRCKGVTIFRDGSRSEQILNVSKSDPVLGELEKELPVIEKSLSENIVKIRPESLWGPTVKVATPCGNLYVTITEDQDGIPLEIFARLGKSGGCATAVMESIGRLGSKWLRSGGDVDELITQLRGVSCGQQCGLGPNRVTSCQDAIGLALERYTDGDYHNVLRDEEEDKQESLEQDVDHMLLPNGIGATKAPNTVVRRNGACPECGSPIEHEGGCSVCRICGYSKCA
jgi:ribonucleoside-diphosphate reductase alpha chain